MKKILLVIFVLLIPVCIFAQDCTSDSDCNTGYVCVDDICFEECLTDNDCSDDFICNTTADICVECLSEENCTVGYLCENNTCVIDEDYNPDECEDGTLKGFCSFEEPYYCNEDGELEKACEGPDQMLGTVDDCGCPANKKCKLVTAKGFVCVLKSNNPPVANAGPDQTVQVREVVYLDGSKSNDEDGDRVVYNWEQISGKTITLSDNTAFRPWFIAGSSGTYTFELTVDDGFSRENQSSDSSDTVVITVGTSATTTTSNQTSNQTTTEEDTSSEQNNCGDGTCSSGESYTYCPEDCQGVEDGVCDGQQDGICDRDCLEVSEQVLTGEDDPDCSSQRTKCGDGICSPGETCPYDCSCGNRICEPENGESKYTCPMDCKGTSSTGISMVIVGIIGSAITLFFYYLFFIKSYTLPFNLPFSSKKEPKSLGAGILPQEAPKPRTEGEYKPSKDDIDSLRKYISKSKSEGIKESQVKDVLLSSGWSRQTIDEASKPKQKIIMQKKNKTKSI